MYRKFLFYLMQYIFGPVQKIFSFFKLKSKMPRSKLKLWTFRIADAHTRATGNLLLLIDGDVEPFLIGISISPFPIPTQQCNLLKWLVVIAFKPGCGCLQTSYIF